MKLWIDTTRSAPAGYIWIKTVSEAIECFEYAERMLNMKDTFYYDISRHAIEEISIDYGIDCDGDNCIEALKYLEIKKESYPIHIHSTDSASAANIRAIIQRNNWKEIF